MVTDPAELLRQRGIQVTAQRLAVLRAVSASARTSRLMPWPMRCRAEIGAISLQSVYDALGVLVAEGLLRRIQPSGSPARFEDRVGDNHHHLVCRICGRMVDIDCAVGTAPCLSAADDKGYEIDEAEVAYWGRCPECLAQSRSITCRHRLHARSPTDARREHERTKTTRLQLPRTVRGQRHMDNEEKCPFSAKRTAADQTRTGGRIS